MAEPTLESEATSLAPFSRSLSRTLIDYVNLTKPRVATLVLFSVGSGVILAALAHGLDIPWGLVGWTVLGSALVSSSASALNQALEIHTDGLMPRTAKRPLPSRRVHLIEAWVFGLITLAIGVAILLGTSHPAATWVALFTHLSYVLIYTPLKTRTHLNTLIGAIPGALPPVIGYVALTGSLEYPCLILFAIVFFWQIPHFLAIAWMYKEQYARAGMRMLTLDDETGSRTASQMRNYTLGLIVVSASPVLFPERVHTSWDLAYLACCLAVGFWFLFSAIGFQKQPGFPSARKVLRVSLLVLPLLLVLLCLDTWITRPGGMEPK